MDKTIKFEGVTFPIVLRKLNANEFVKLQQSHSRTSLFSNIKTLDTYTFCKALVYSAVESPKFENAEALLEALTPGQYSTLLDKVSVLQGFEKEENGNG